MSSTFRFAIISDLHIAVPETIWEHPSRFHRVEVSIPALDCALHHLAQVDLDFLLLPGDLTQHGEPANHQWLSQRLSQLPYPVYVVPGNHDLVSQEPLDNAIAAKEFPQYYQKFGYNDPDKLYYCYEVLPGVSLIGLNSIAFDEQGQQYPVGYLDSEQLSWLRDILPSLHDQLVMVMIHHNVIEHLPGQASHILGRRYMLSNADELLQELTAAHVNLIFTGHLHVQDVAQQGNIYEITTGSLVSYPHPYRLIQVHHEPGQSATLTVESHWINELPNFPNLLQSSREWIGDRSFPFMMKLLTHAPLSMPPQEAEQIAPDLRYFWADIAHGDQQFSFPTLPPDLQPYFQRFGAIDVNGCHTPIDNQATLSLKCNVNESLMG